MQSYLEFLKLTAQEKKSLDCLYLADISNMTQNSLLFNQIVNIDLVLLIKSALLDNQIDAICKLSVFDHHWQEIWRQCGLNPPEDALENKQPVHENLPQLTIHTFDFLKAIILYGEYQNIINSTAHQAEALATPYLMAAAKLAYFPAQVILNKKYLAYSKTHNHEMYAQKALDIAFDATEKYWAAGYFLLGITYIQLAENKNSAFLTQGCTMLLIAKKLLPYSQEMVNNAFQGQNLSLVTNGKIKDWEDIPNYFTKIQGSLKVSEINIIYKSVNELVKQFEEQWHQFHHQTPALY